MLDKKRATISQGRQALREERHMAKTRKMAITQRRPPKDEKVETMRQQLEAKRQQRMKNATTRPPQGVASPTRHKRGPTALSPMESVAISARSSHVPPSVAAGTGRRSTLGHT
jgi:hypothetical protein